MRALSRAFGHFDDRQRTVAGQQHGQRTVMLRREVLHAHNRECRTLGAAT